MRGAVYFTIGKQGKSLKVNGNSPEAEKKSGKGEVLGTERETGHCRDSAAELNKALNHGIYKVRVKQSYPG